MYGNMMNEWIFSSFMKLSQLLCSKFNSKTFKKNNTDQRSQACLPTKRV
jgi:hypothetical protein